MCFFCVVNTRKVWRHTLSVGITVLVIGLIVPGQTSFAQQTTAVNSAVIEFEAPWDWLQLTTGEWLKGEVLGMAKDSLEFDSDNLDELDIDWEDVKALYTSEPMEVLLDDLQTVTGRLETREGQLHIVAQQPVTVSFDQVLGLASSSSNEWQNWSGDIGVAADYESGNTEEEDLSITARLQRRTSQSNFLVTYVGNQSRDNNVETSDENRINANYDYRLSRKWFWQPVVFEYYSDPFQNIDAQWTYGMGLGVYLIESDKTNWTISAGPGYSKTRYVNTQPGVDKEVTSNAFYFSNQFDYELTSDIDITATYQLTAMDDEAGKAKHHAVVKISIDLIGSLDLNAAAYWDRIAEPLPDDNGVTPLPNDYRYTLGLSYDF